MSFLRRLKRGIIKHSSLLLITYVILIASCLFLYGLLSPKFLSFYGGPLVMELMTEPVSISVVDDPIYLEQGLKHTNFLIISNVPSSAIPKDIQTLMKDFVKNGGILILLPGSQAYGQGLWQNSVFGGLIPVKIRSMEDIVYESGEVEILGKSYHYSFYHNVTLKEGATQLASINSIPVVAYWKFGRGYVIAVTTYIDSQERLIVNILSYLKILDNTVLNFLNVLRYFVFFASITLPILATLVGITKDFTQSIKVSITNHNNRLEAFIYIIPLLLFPLIILSQELTDPNLPAQAECFYYYTFPLELPKEWSCLAPIGGHPTYVVGGYAWYISCFPIYFISTIFSIPMHHAFKFVLLVYTILAGFSAYYVCLKLVHRPPSALLAGLLYEFSPIYVAECLGAGFIEMALGYSLTPLTFYFLWRSLTFSKLILRDSVIAGTLLALVFLAQYKIGLRLVIFLLIPTFIYSLITTRGRSTLSLLLITSTFVLLSSPTVVPLFFHVIMLREFPWSVIPSSTDILAGWHRGKIPEVLSRVGQGTNYWLPLLESPFSYWWGYVLSIETLLALLSPLLVRKKLRGLSMILSLGLVLSLLYAIGTTSDLSLLRQLANIFAPLRKERAPLQAFFTAELSISILISLVVDSLAKDFETKLNKAIFKLKSIVVISFIVLILVAYFEPLQYYPFATYRLPQNYYYLAEILNREKVVCVLDVPPGLYPIYVPNKTLGRWSLWGINPWLPHHDRLAAYLSYAFYIYHIPHALGEWWCTPYDIPMRTYRYLSEIYRAFYWNNSWHAVHLTQRLPISHVVIDKRAIDGGRYIPFLKFLNATDDVILLYEDKYFISTKFDDEITDEYKDVGIMYTGDLYSSFDSLSVLFPSKHWIVMPDQVDRTLILRAMGFIEKNAPLIIVSSTIEDLATHVAILKSDPILIEAEDHLSGSWFASDYWQPSSMFYSAATSANDSLSIPIVGLKGGLYRIYARIFCDSNRAHLKIMLDGRQIPTSEIVDKAHFECHGFRWFCLGEFPLEGRHVLTFENLPPGANDIDCIAVVPSSKFVDEYTKVIDKLLGTNIVIAIEPELEYKGSAFPSTWWPGHGFDTSGAHLTFIGKMNVTINLKAPKDKEYYIYFRLFGESVEFPRGVLKIDVNGKRVGEIRPTGKGWVLVLLRCRLKSGNNKLTIYQEEGFNDVDMILVSTLSLSKLKWLKLKVYNMAYWSSLGNNALPIDNLFAGSNSTICYSWFEDYIMSFSGLFVWSISKMRCWSIFFICLSLIALSILMFSKRFKIIEKAYVRYIKKVLGTFKKK